METVTIASRFRGPPTSGNGGYCCGLVGSRIPGASEVTLRSPPPLDRPLRIDRTSEGGVRLRDGEAIVAEGRPASLELEARPALSFDEATARSVHFLGFDGHVFPTCFVCGPERSPGDGLRIFAGRGAGDEAVAAPWIPDASLAGDDGLVRPEHLWAALDCPGYFAISPPRLALLGRMTAEVLTPLGPGARCILMGWPLAEEGRKLHAMTALYTEDGNLVGQARQTWIAVERT
jgi:hypothetical protein